MIAPGGLNRRPCPVLRWDMPLGIGRVGCKIHEEKAAISPGKNGVMNAPHRAQTLRRRFGRCRETLMASRAAAEWLDQEILSPWQGHAKVRFFFCAVEAE
eukprot:615096-Rhodomonas_salina.1